MPNSRPSQGLPPLHFIDANPAVEAYRAGQKFDLSQRTGEANLEGQNLSNEFAGRAMPTRLRQIEANLEGTQLGNEYSSGSMGSRLRSAEAGARSAEAGADVAEGTVPSRIETSQAGARSATAGARTAESNANVSEETEPTRVAQANTNLRQAEASAANTEMQGFYKSLELLNKGEVDAAKEIARRFNSELPDAVINDAELRGAITAAAKRAQELYPNQPANQQKFIEGHLNRIAEDRKAGRSVSGPTQTYTMPAGAPTPPEVGGTGGGAGAGGGRAPADVATATWLVQKGVAPNEAAAWEMVRASRANPNVMYTQVYNSALRATFGNAARAKQIADEWRTLDQRNRASQPQPQPTPAPTPTPQPPAQASGLGTAQNPHRPQSQADFDALPRGAVFINPADGKPYRKN